MPIDMNILLTLRISNPYLFLYGTPDALHQIFTMILPLTRSFAAQHTYDEILIDKGKGIHDAYQTHLTTGESARKGVPSPPSMAVTIEDIYGSELVAAGIVTVDPGPGFLEITTAPYKAELAATAARTKADADLYIAQREADGNKAKLEAEAKGGAAIREQFIESTRKALLGGIPVDQIPAQIPVVAAIVANKDMADGQNQKVYVVGGTGLLAAGLEAIEKATGGKP
jgi:regulator of protease activity HflC (stomatin/prohibitin superfamily)